MNSHLHVLWTPSWYPHKQFPLNGSFFQEQVGMLRHHGLNVGVVSLAPKSVRQWRPHELQTDLDEQAIRGDVLTIPGGLIPGDYQLIRAQAMKAAKIYAANWGVPDVIHAHSVFPGAVLAHVLAKHWGIPFGLTEHRPSTLEQSKTNYRWRYLLNAVANASFRLAVSDGFAQQLTNHYDIPFDTIALPVSDIFFDTVVHPNSKYTFAHISNLDRNKRVEELLNAFASVLQQHPHTRLLIIGGDAPRVTELTNYAHDLGIGQRVSFTGAVPRAQIPATLGRARCLVLTSAVESAGAVFAEAQALGIPCIATATDGGSFMVNEHSGMVIPVDDPTALTAAMKQMISHGAQHYQPSQVRFQAKRRFSATEFARTQLRWYHTAQR